MAGSGGQAADGSSGGDAGPGGAECVLPIAEPKVTRTYAPQLFSSGADPSAEPECTGVINPERGIFQFRELRALGSVSGLRAQGYTLIYGKVLVNDYLDRDFDAALLSTLSSALSQTRQAGIKVLPRFHYSDAIDQPDAPLARVLEHIESAGPVLQGNSDVIAALHAGFVGAWGEWHSSTNALTDPAARKSIFDALLAVLPDTRMVLARRPSHKQIAYGGPLTEQTAFTGSPLARIGHLNDCFLASDNDSGTYQVPGEKEYAVADSAFTAVGGETCALNPPRSECASALAELELHHFSFINTSYNTAVIDSWRAGGCWDTIRCRLGYRLVITGHDVPVSVVRRAALGIAIRLVNDGYAPPYNPRPVFLVLDGPARLVGQVDVDPRRWAPDVETELCLGTMIPAELLPGNYRVGLWLPDASDSLSSDSRYAVRIASGATWDESSGINWLDAELAVTD
jgi:hypothetical protein